MNGGLGGLEILRQVEAKYPALLFKQQLTAFVEKLYGMLRDNLKKEISPLLTACIQVSRLFYLLPGIGIFPCLFIPFSVSSTVLHLFNYLRFNRLHIADK